VFGRSSETGLQIVFLFQFSQFPFGFSFPEFIKLYGLPFHSDRAQVLEFAFVDQEVMMAELF
jgi:hypothetical protein